jgi:hypothetical protein
VPTVDRGGSDLGRSSEEEYYAKLTMMKVFDGRVTSPEEKAQVQEPVRHWMDDHIAPESDLRDRTSFELGFGPAGEQFSSSPMTGVWI